MPRGASDYSNVRVETPLHRLDDLAELAARLGSPDTYDRCGNVVWLMDFESGLQGTSFGVDHSDSVGSVSAARSCMGGFSLKFDPRGEDDAYVEWGRLAHFLPTSKIGAEISISTDTDPAAVRFMTFYANGTHILRGDLYYEPSTGTWSVLGSDNEWVVVLDDFKLQQGASAWHPIKLVIDVENAKYIRVLISQYVIDLSDYDMRSDPSDSKGQMELRVKVEGSEAANAAVYVDGVIVTQNEQ